MDQAVRKPMGYELFGWLRFNLIVKAKVRFLSFGLYFTFLIVRNNETTFNMVIVIC